MRSKPRLPLNPIITLAPFSNPAQFFSYLLRIGRSHAIKTGKNEENENLV